MSSMADRCILWCHTFYFWKSAKWLQAIEFLNQDRARLLGSPQATTIEAIPGREEALFGGLTVRILRLYVLFYARLFSFFFFFFFFFYDEQQPQPFNKEAVRAD